jgi:bacillithiol synthase
MTKGSNGRSNLLQCDFRKKTTSNALVTRRDENMAAEEVLMTVAAKRTGEGDSKLAKHECIPFAAVPHSAPLFLDFISHSSKVNPFYPHKPIIEEVERFARGLEYPVERRAAMASILERQNRAFGSSKQAMQLIERLRSGAVAVISGQQVGLFGGPLYSVLKAVSAIQMAKDLTERGVEAVPVFWLATEDHDLAEVNHAFYCSGGTLKKVTSTSTGKSEAPVGEIRFGQEIEAVADEFAATLSDKTIAAAVRESYTTGETFGSAFGNLFARLFADHGLILLDPLDAELHKLAAPVLRSAAEQAHELDLALLERGKELRAAGYHEQVKVTAASTLLFSLKGGHRKVIQVAGDDFMIGAHKVPRAELLEEVSSHPELFSANVLLRPVMQDYLLPTAVYFGGAAEVAYFAQNAVVSQRVLGRVTPAMARFSATVLSSEDQRLLQKYRLGMPDLFHGTEELQEKLAKTALAPALQHELSAAEDSVRTHIDKLRGQLKTLDPTLVDAAERSGRKMQYQLSKIRRKAARAEARKNAELRADAESILCELFPGKDLQERTLPGVYFLSKYPRLIDDLLYLAGEYCPGHHLVKV